MSTFASFLTECELYPHSQESYNLMKECAELQVMARYLDDQKFIQENAAMLESVSQGENAISDGYMVESVAEDNYEAVQQEFTEKANNIMGKIVAGFKKVLATIKNFFMRLKNRWTDYGKNCAKLVKVCEVLDRPAVTLKNDQIAELGKMITDAGLAFRPEQLNVQPLKKVLPKKYKELGKEGLSTNFCLAISAATSNTYVILDTVKMGCGSAINADDLAKYTKQIEHAIGSTRQAVAVKNITRALNASITDAREHGLTIVVNEKSISKAIEAVNSLETRLNEANAAATTTENNENASATAVATAGLNEVYSQMIKSIRDSIKAYNAVNTLYSKIVPAMIEKLSHFDGFVNQNVDSSIGQTN